MERNTKYIIITPVRNEGKHLERTITSVIGQTIAPGEWIIVNDGSSDNTADIIDAYAKKYGWIRAIHRKDRGYRKAGGGVVEAFYDGYKAISSEDWNYLVKLDGDLTFDSGYFEKCFQKFDKDEKLGIGGGTVYNVVQGKLELEKGPQFHVRGATKIYRKKCWQDINGLLAAPGWDTLDEVKANMMGWQTCCFPDLKLAHHKYTGSADGTWGGWVKNGRANYISGYHPLFMTLKCMRRVFKKPVLIGALGLLYGFVSGYLKSVPQGDDRALIGYMRRQQMNKRLMRESIWK